MRIDIWIVLAASLALFRLPRFDYLASTHADPPHPLGLLRTRRQAA